MAMAMAMGIPPVLQPMLLQMSAYRLFSKLLPARCANFDAKKLHYAKKKKKKKKKYLFVPCCTLR
jgi:hypothetical protein